LPVVWALQACKSITHQLDFNMHPHDALHISAFSFAPPEPNVRGLDGEVRKRVSQES
jgi:hypothetical protein